MRKTNKELCYVALWVDDCLFVGHEQVLNESVKNLESHFKLKIVRDTSDYLSCEIIYNKELTMCWVGQPHLCKKIEQTFGPLVKNLQKFRTPGTPGLQVTKPLSPGAVISEQDQRMYRSSIGMLLYLVKHSRPNIANALRELSKGMKEATPNALKELKRVLKFVIDTKDYGFKLEP